MQRSLVHLCLIAAFATVAAAAPYNFPLAFEPNHGQVDAHVRYVARGAGYNVFLSPREAVLALDAATVRMKLVGASAAPRIDGLELQRSKTSYLVGSDQAKWQRDVPNYARVRYSDAYPGIDVVFYGAQRRLEYDFVVAPGADPRNIALAFDGVEKLAVDANGDLVMHVGGDRTLRQHKPVAYQETANGRTPVTASYALAKNGRVTFRLGRYDRSKKLVIDPVISYSTYLGGGYYDFGNDIAVDANGNAYIAGQASALGFPVTPGALQSDGGNDGYGDAFVAKFDARGALVYSTILGRGAPDVAFAIAVDAAGNAYVAGEFGLDPPLTPGSVQTPQSGADAHVFKINPQGNGVIYGARVGGTFDERAYGIGIDRDGNAVVAGTNHGSLDFPTVNAAQPRYGGGYTDAFVFKLNAAGTALVYSTNLGGGTNVDNNNRRVDDGTNVAVDAAGNAYVTGMTASDDFPVTPGALDHYGSYDPFVTKYSPSGQIVYSARFGGDFREIVWDVAVDNAGSAYVVGDMEHEFPTTPGAYRTTGDFEGFVTKINATGTAMVYSTLIGGPAGYGSDNGLERVAGVAVDAAGQAHITGHTRSREFPLVNPIISTHQGGGQWCDAFVAKLNAQGSALLFSTYLGGNNDDEAEAIALDAAGSMYVVGSTSSTTFPTTPGAAQRINGSDGGDGTAHTDAFVTKISEPRAATKPILMSADFGGDNKSEIHWKHATTGNHAMWELSGRTLINGNIFTSADVNWDVQGYGDFNGDAKADILLRHRTTDEIAIWQMNGRTVVAKRTILKLVSSQWQLQAIGNFNADNRSELIWRHAATGQLAMWEMNGFTLLSGAIFATQADLAWEVLASGDFNADGRAELLWRHATSGELAIWEMNGRGVTNRATFATMVDPNWKMMATGDFNGDRATDLLWQNSATGETKMWELSGRTILRAQSIVTVKDFGWRLETSGDFDADGRSELIWHHASTGDVAMWQLNGATLLNGAILYRVQDLNWTIQPSRRTAAALSSSRSSATLAVEDEGFAREGFIPTWEPRDLPARPRERN